jgi:hypothetical protein
MNDRLKTLVTIAATVAIYSPASMYFFDNSLSTMLDRAYFILTGAAIALYAPARARTQSGASDAPL